MHMWWGVVHFKGWKHGACMMCVQRTTTTQLNSTQHSHFTSEKNNPD